jgi:uncharacterized protein YggE
MRNWLTTALLLALPAAAAAQEKEAPRTITVSGHATVEREPDRALLTFAVENEAGTARAASQANAAAMDRVVAALRRAGLASAAIRTVGYGLTPVYTRPRAGEEPPRIAGYRATNAVQVTVDDLPRLGALIDGAVDAGANRVTGIDFQLRDAEAARLEALVQAVASARREADAAARAAGQQLGPPLSMQTSYHVPFPRAERALAVAADVAMVQPPTPVEAGTLTISANVHIVFRLDMP